MGNQPPLVIGPNLPWDVCMTKPPNQEQFEEFYEFMRPLTLLDHPVRGRASLLPGNDDEEWLRPIFMLNGDIHPLSRDEDVEDGRADCTFVTHPKGSFKDEAGGDCWPFVTDLMTAFRRLGEYWEQLQAHLIVTWCGLVVITRHPNRVSKGSHTFRVHPASDPIPTNKRRKNVVATTV